jgi:hypothetical protein
MTTFGEASSLSIVLDIHLYIPRLYLHKSQFLYYVCFRLQRTQIWNERPYILRSHLTVRESDRWRYLSNDPDELFTHEHSYFRLTMKAFERYLPKPFYSKGEGKRNDEGWLNIKRRV